MTPLFSSIPDVPRLFSLLTIFSLILPPLLAQQAPRVTIANAPPNPAKYSRTVYPWKKNITATVFWIGETPTPNNPTPNHKSSWDQAWQKNYGGFDNPKKSARNGYVPKSFTPKLNPFYIALPYNDCLNYKTHKPEAARVIPWFKRMNPKPGKTVCKGRWVQIVANKRVCYAQWEDCGPFLTNDYQYVFGNRPPRNTKNQSAGIDISPAVRDYLGIKSSAKVHWRFIEFAQVPKGGPWAQLGTNNPFKNPKIDPDRLARIRYYDYLRKLRDEGYKKKDVSRSN